jgi:hypothetical protein
VKYIEQINENVISNLNIEHFGNIIERKCLLWAIDNKIICDYVIQTLITDKIETEELFNYFHIKDENNQRLFLSAYISLKSIYCNQSHHLLIYTNTQENCIKVIKYIKMLLDDNYFNIPNLYLSEYHSEIYKKEQIDILDKYNNSQFGILSNVYCLGEGYDNPLIDGVIFSENMSSNIRIVQSALRASRTDKLRPDKITKIILPILNIDFSQDNNQDLKKVRQVIYQMGLEDQTISEKMKVIKINLNKHILSISKICLIPDFGEYDYNLTEHLKLKTIHRTELSLSYNQAVKILADKHILSKKQYLEICKKDFRLPQEPESVFKSDFTNWVDYLSIQHDYYDLNECRQKVNEYTGNLKLQYLDTSDLIIKLCHIDAKFPPADFWTDYYNTKNIGEIIIKINKYKKRT